MAAVTLTYEDLKIFDDTIDTAKAGAMCADALARATRLAPCIAEADFPYAAAAKAILRDVVLRWNERGTGAVTQRSTGPFIDTFGPGSAPPRLFWPSEITELQDLCKSTAQGSALPVFTMPDPPTPDLFR